MKRKQQQKILPGTKVRILRACPGAAVGWVASMNEYVGDGKIYYVTRHHEHGVKLTPHADLTPQEDLDSVGCWWFPWESLEIVEVPQPPEHRPEVRTISEAQKRFERFDSEHPEIWERFVHYAWQAIFARVPRIGARAILERIRWDATIHPEQHRGFRFNNSHTPHYARKFREHFPEHADLLEVRGGE